MLASVMPFETMLELLEKEIADYKENPCEDNEKKVSMTCMLLASKSAIASSGGLEKVIEETERMRDGYELLTPKNQ